MRKFLLFVLLFAIHWIARGQTQYGYRYWFDGDESSMQVGTVGTEKQSMDIDAQNLSSNFHLLYFQVKDADGLWSSVKCRGFYKAMTDEEKQASQLLYGIDGGILFASAEKADNMFHFNLDASGYQDGLHCLTYAMKLPDGTISSQKHSYFYKVSTDLTAEQVDCVFLIDGVTVKTEKLKRNQSAFITQLELTGLHPGLHQASIYLVTAEGSITKSEKCYFYRALTDTEKDSFQFLYAVDRDTQMIPAGKMDGNTFRFNLDMSKLQDGLHCLTYALALPDGTISSQKYKYFYKTPAEATGIAHYEYWVNDDTEKKQTVQVENVSLPYQIVEDLLLEEYPIRSKNFVFAIEDGHPIIYAKNDFSFRFSDDKGYVSERQAPFVDLRSRKSIMVNKTLWEHEESIELDKPTENQIVWYAVRAEQGNEIYIKTDKASSLQIFSPEGTEVYSASGASSQEFGGLTVEKAGVYYIALHDVTSNAGKKMVFSYQHLGDFDTAISPVLMDKNILVDVYSAQGILVRKRVKAAQALNGLRAGVYVINNVKYVVK